MLHEQPHVVFPGNLQGRHVRETGPKGAYLVTVETGEVADLTHLEMDVVRWLVLEVDVTQTGDIGDIVDLIREALVQGGKRGQWAAAGLSRPVEGPHRATRPVGDGCRRIDGRGAIRSARSG